MTHNIEKLKKDYTENVLPHIFKNISETSLTDYLVSAFDGKFSLELDIKSILNCAPQFKPSGKAFIHFTNLKALHSIVNEMALRMYNLNNVKDPEEFQMIAKDFGYNDLQINLFKERAFVMCVIHSIALNTSKSIDLWKHYGNEGEGCAIELEIEENQSSLIKFVKIVYGKPDYRKFFIANKKFEERNNIQVDLKDLIKLSACIHKDNFYAFEDEVRLLHDDGAPNPISSFKKGNPYKYDFNSKNKIVSYYKLDLYKEEIGYPHIKIKRIQLGFNYKEEDLKNIKEHFGLLFLGISNQLGKKIDTPIIEISPLKGKFV